MAAAWAVVALAAAACSRVAACPPLPAPEPSTVGPAGYALLFCGAGRDDIDRVKIPIDDPDTSLPGPPIDVGATDFTLELWMLAAPGRNRTPPVECGPNSAWIFGNIFVDRDRYNQDREYGLSLAGGMVVFGVRGESDDALTVCGRSRIDDGEWHHVAVTRARATGALQLFVDGAVDARSEAGPLGDISYPDDGVPGEFCRVGRCVESDPYLVFGAEKHDVGEDYPAFVGLVDEVRLSTAIRYAGPFERPGAPFEPDSLTVGLWHFDDGEGTSLTDSSPSAAHGSVRIGGPNAAPRWTISGAPLR